MKYDRIMNISEVRERLSDVREAALYRGAIVRWGDRGRDELVTLSREVFQRLVERGAEGAGGAEADDWAGFEAAMEQGRLSVGGGPAPRRRQPGSAADSSVPWDDMAKMAGGEGTRRRPRPAPR